MVILTNEMNDLLRYSKDNKYVKISHLKCSVLPTLN